MITENRVDNGVLVSPAYAQYMIDMCAMSPDEQELIARPIRKHWVSYLAEQMRLGRFQPTSIIATVKCNDRTYLVNGNHTLRAILESGVALRLPTIEYATDDFGDVRELYAKFDRGLSRSTADALRAYGTMAMLGLDSNTDVAQLAAASRVIRQKFNHAIEFEKIMVADEDLIPVMEQYSGAYSRLKHLWGGGTKTAFEWSRALARKDVLAIVLVTGEHSARGDAFWELVSSGIGYTSKYDPALRTRDYLGQLRRKGPNYPFGDSTTLIRLKLAYLWNAYTDGREVVQLRLPRGPIAINETPYVVDDGTASN